MKYPGLFLRTCFVLIRRTPVVLFVQSPSVVLALIAGILKPVLRYKLVVDAHNEAVVPFNFSFAGYKWILKRAIRMADLTIVTNKHLVERVRENGGIPFCLPDAIPTFANMAERQKEGNEVLFICTFSPDEPFANVIESARHLPAETSLLVTGNHHKTDSQIVENAPSNVRFLGFVPEDEYIQCLQSADVVVDLTHMDHCLVCGAYEAVAACTPLVTSDTATLRQHFSKGTVYSTHDSKSIAKNITFAVEHNSDLKEEMISLKHELRRKWDVQKETLESLLFESSQCAE